MVRTATVAASATTAVARRAMTTTNRAEAWLLQQMASTVGSSGQIKLESSVLNFLTDVTSACHYSKTQDFLHHTHSNYPF